jgi:hypothetical protein
MKTFNIFFKIVLFFVVFMAYYFMLSLLGMLWAPYTNVITNSAWFLTYTLFLGWWLAEITVFPNGSIDNE